MGTISLVELLSPVSQALKIGTQRGFFRQESRRFLRLAVLEARVFGHQAIDEIAVFLGDSRQLPEEVVRGHAPAMAFHHSA
jgi:hypothetical protein